MSNKIICLMGPTASGKTQLALKLAQRFPCEIISVDSALVYREMNIGTAKPTLEERQNIPHHLIDICNPPEVYSAGKFREDALEKIAAILNRGYTPLLVGGTMLYFHILQQGLSPLPQADITIRNRIAEKALELGWENLHAKLQQIDPQAAQRIHPHDSQRIARALEIYELTGKTFTAMTAEKLTSLPYKIVNLAITSNRNLLQQRIATRFETMLQRGFVEEVKNLRERYPNLTSDMPSMRAVGYRQIWDYLENKYTYAEMKERAIIATRQLAKRQMTWLRSWENIKWFENEDSSLISKVEDFLQL